MFVVQYKLAEANIYLNESFAFFERNKKKTLAADCLFNLAKSYHFLHNDSEALKKYLYCQQFYEDLNDKYSALKVYNNIGMIELDQSNYEKASYYFNLEKTNSIDVNDSLSYARSLVNLSLSSQRKMNYNESITYGLQGLEAFNQQGDKLGQAAALQNLANTYSKISDYPKALLYSDRALVVFQDLHDIKGIARTFGVLGDLCKKIGNEEDGIFYIYGAIVFNRYLEYNHVTQGKIDYWAHTSILQEFKQILNPIKFNSDIANARFKLNSMCQELGLDKVDLSLQL
jgi:tetratricopeptide (TPR) repeat protein